LCVEKLFKKKDLANMCKLIGCSELITKRRVTVNALNFSMITAH